MALAATGRDGALSRLRERMREVTAKDNTNAAMTRDVGLPLAEGMIAFARGRYRDAVAMLEPARDGAHRFVGSHAQSDVITLTLIEAAIRDRDRTRAQHYV